jgi:hypothetical protein
MTHIEQRREWIRAELEGRGVVIETLPGCIRLNGPYNSRILITDLAALSRREINRLCAA